MARQLRPFLLWSVLPDDEHGSGIGDCVACRITPRSESSGKKKKVNGDSHSGR